MSNIDTTDLMRQFRQSLVKKKVGIIEFAESEEFCNTPLYPRQRTLLKILHLEELDGYDEDVLSEWIKQTEEGGEVRIVPQVRERIQFLREHEYDHFTTAQLVQGRRSGKGYMTGVSIAKKVYDLVQLEDPAMHYGVARGENIYFTIAADSQDQAKKYQFKDARNWILECGPLQEFIGQALAESITIYTPADLRRLQTLRDRRVSADKALASLRVEAFAKNARTIRGNASIMLIFDEMAHITPGESHISDVELFEAAEPSLMQFGKHAMIFANSSPYQKLGKFYELYEQSQELDAGEIVYPTMFMIQSPSWEMYRDWDKEFKWKDAVSFKEWHWPRAIAFSPDDEHPDAYEMRQKERKNPEKFKVEYRAQFAEVIDAFLDPYKVDQMFDPEHTVVTLGRELEVKHSGTIEYVYKAHGDPSTTGANFGFAIAHVEEVEEVLESGEVIFAPHVVFDLIEAFYPEDYEDRTIDWLEIMPVFSQYINHFRPYEFTFDQFNSIAPIQMLTAEAQKMGAWETNIYVKTATAPANRRRAMNFKAALNLGRVHAPHPHLYKHRDRNPIELGREELKRLQEKNGRVDKQEIGPIQTKDIADCIMECVDALIGESLSADAQLLTGPPAFGAHQGYSIGNRTSGGQDAFDVFYRGGRHPQPTHDPARGRKGNFTRR